MRLEYDLLKRKRGDFTKLIDYGFVRTDEIYAYTCDLGFDDLTCILTVDENGVLTGKVMDAFEEEYIGIHIAGNGGDYVTTVRKYYLKILEDVARKCFYDVPFIFNQANRIHEAVKQKYGCDASYPFKKFPHYAAYYNEAHKWFMLIMEQDYSVLCERSGECEILNLKVADPEVHLKKDGIYRAYHMSKKSWVSVVLDETLSDEEIMALIDKSYILCAGNSIDKEACEWIFPANPKVYDLDHAFTVTDKLYWKQSAKVSVGDLVYIYYGMPVGSIRYLCEVVETDIQAKTEDLMGADVLMRIGLKKKFTDGKLNRELLKKFGVTNIRGARHMVPELKREIERLYEECSGDD